VAEVGRRPGTSAFLTVWPENKKPFFISNHLKKENYLMRSAEREEENHSFFVGN
jgi:hypothetical protein